MTEGGRGRGRGSWEWSFYSPLVVSPTIDASGGRPSIVSSARECCPYFENRHVRRCVAQASSRSGSTIESSKSRPSVCCVLSTLTYDTPVGTKEHKADHRAAVESTIVFIAHQKRGTATTAASCMPALKVNPTGVLRMPSCVRVGICGDTTRGIG